MIVSAQKIIALNLQIPAF